METKGHALQLLPVINMAGTDFYADTEKNEFREVDQPSNRISMDEIRRNEEGITSIAYDQLTKNIYEELIDPEHIPAHVKLVVIPKLEELGIIAGKQQGPKMKIIKHIKGHRL